MSKITETWIITHICGDTVNIPTYTIIECEKGKICEVLDNHYDFKYNWRTNRFVKLYKAQKYSKPTKLV